MLLQGISSCRYKDYDEVSQVEKDYNLKRALRLSTEGNQGANKR